MLVTERSLRACTSLWSPMRAVLLKLLPIIRGMRGTMRVYLNLLPIMGTWCPI